MLRRMGVVFAGAAMAIGAGLVGPGTGVAFAAAPSANWSISSLAQPTSFSAGDNKSCEEKETGEHCDTYTLTITNTGSEKVSGSSHPIVIKDTLPAGLKVERVATPGFSGGESFIGEGVELEAEEKFSCGHALSTVTCEFSGTARVGDTLTVGIDVLVEPTLGAGEQQVVNSATVEGGGLSATTAPANTVNAASPAKFGVQDFSMNAYGVDGAPDLRAGDHPYALTTRFDLNTVFKGEILPNNPLLPFYEPAQEPKDIVVYLPLGLVGDPLAAAQCTEAGLQGEQPLTSHITTKCPADSRVGTISVNDGGNVGSTLEPKKNNVSAIYNMVPEGGYPAEFGFFYVHVPVVMFASVVPASVVIPSASGYLLRVASQGIPRPGAAMIDGASLTFFGDPAEHNIDEKGEPLGAPTAFFSNPVDCSSGPLKARVEADSWEEPGHYVARETVVYPGVTGCNMLQFNPTLEVTPETTVTDEPSGYTVDLKVTQAPNLAPNLATPDLKNATVTLPEGVSLSPSTASGLGSCAETGPHGINITGPEAVEMGEGVRDGSPYDDGLEHIAPGHCPQSSQIGTVNITTPLLPKPLEGHVYVAQPKCGGPEQLPCSTSDATNGNLFGLYLEAAGSGVIVKLKGIVSVNPTTGQLTTRFAENPQLPFSDLKLQLKGGPRAALADPQVCGGASTTSDLVPWSSPQTPDATPSSLFTVTGCQDPAFGPTFLAETLTPKAGSFSPFTLTFTRKDGEQDISAIQVTIPPGLLGTLASVPLCGEPQAQQGTCPSASQIGTTTVASGAGSRPFWISGRVYLTDPYKGAPFGLSVVVPAVAGPFNLGDVVVRSTITVNPSNSTLTITSDPLPQIIDGVPFRLQTVNVTVDRPSFMFNPTNCSAKQITATIASAQGAAAHVSAPFAVEGCANLPFKPKFTTSTQGKASARGNGASLGVKVTQRPGEANIHKVDVQLPIKLPARLTTLRKACTEAQFAANPSGCPNASFIGTATARTPVLNVPLTGPAILVSHGGAAFPDLVVILQGEGVVIDLTGGTDIKKGITYSRFESVPDAPISSFELKLPEGPNSALAAPEGNLCGKQLIMPTTITGQNGAVVRQSTKVTVTGCPRKRGKKATFAARKGSQRRSK